MDCKKLYHPTFTRLQRLSKWRKQQYPNFTPQKNKHENKRRQIIK